MCSAFATVRELYDLRCILLYYVDWILKNGNVFNNMILNIYVSIVFAFQ